MQGRAIGTPADDIRVCAACCCLEGLLLLPLGMLLSRCVGVGVTLCSPGFCPWPARLSSAAELLRLTKCYSPFQQPLFWAPLRRRSSRLWPGLCAA